MSVKGGGGVSRPAPLRMCQLQSELLKVAQQLQCSDVTSDPDVEEVKDSMEEQWKREDSLTAPSSQLSQHSLASQQSWRRLVGPSPQATTSQTYPKPPSYRVPFKSATPRSSHKKSTPLKMRPKPSTLKKTPNSRNPSFKPLFTPEKDGPHPHNSITNRSTEKSSRREIIFAAPYLKTPNMNKNDKLNRDMNSIDMLMDKLNLSNNSSLVTHNQSKISTPESSHISSNSILRECRDNIVTPYKYSESEKKKATPMQHSSIPLKARTPLWPMKEIPPFGSNYRSVSKAGGHLYSVKEKENSPVHPKLKLFETSIENSMADLETSSQTKTSNKSDESSNLITAYESKLSNTIEMTPRTVPKASDDRKFEVDKENMKNLSLLQAQNNVQPKSMEILQMPHILSPEIFNKPLTSKKLTTNNEPIDEIRKNNQNDKILSSNRIQQHIPVKPIKDDVIARSISPKIDLNEILSNVEVSEKKTIQQFKTLTVKGKSYTILGKLGSGGSSEVLKVMDTEDSSMYAIKCVNLAVHPSIAESYINEIKLLQRLQGSDRVITMHNFEFVKQQKILNVLLEMGDVDLSSLLKSYRQREKSIPYPILIGYWTEMLTAVNVIHKNGIIHSDLKPANFILVHGRLKLIDFGIASSLNMDATSIMRDSTMGTFNYLSPEAIAMNSGGNVSAKISYKSDVWSLGCILYSMLYGRTPFSHITHMYGKIAALVNPNQKIEYPPLEGVPPMLLKALRWCLTFDIKQRPSVQELIDLPYINCTSARSSSECVQDVPLPIIAKIKSVLTEPEWRVIAKILEDARK